MRRTATVLGVVVALAVAGGACAGGGEEPEVPSDIVISPASPSVRAGETVQLTAEVRDQNGDPVSGAVVTWTSLNATLATVTATGLVTSVGPTGQATIQASYLTLNRSASVQITAGDPVSFAFATRFLAVDSGARDSVGITAVDRFGNASAVPSLTWTSRDPAIAGSGGGRAVQGLRSGQTIMVASAGTSVDSLLVAVTKAGGQLARVTIPFEVAAGTTAAYPVVVDMRSSTQRLGSAAIDVRWDPARLLYVSTEMGAIGTPVMNTDSTATGLLRLTFANSTGFPGLVELLRIRFQAAASAGPAGAVTVDVREASAAVTFTNLVTTVLPVSQPVRIR